MPEPSIAARAEPSSAFLLSGFERSPADVQRILRERAARLAEVIVEPEVVVSNIEVVVVHVGEQRFAVECIHVRESCSLKELTPVPCTPDHVVGIVNFRGEIVPIVDLEILLGFGVVEGGRGQFLVVTSPLGLVGLLIDTVGEVHEVPEAAATKGSSPYTKGVVLDDVAVLDVQAMIESSYLRDEAAAELSEE